MMAANRRPSLVVVRNRTLVRRFFESLSRGTPKAVAAVLRGPIRLVNLQADGAGRLGRWSLRPIEVVLSSDFVLHRRFSVPRQARADAKSAIAIFVEQQTPFSIEDLLVHAREEERPRDDDAISYALTIAPRKNVETALTASGVAPRSIARLSTVGSTVVDLAPTLHARPSWERWSIVVTVVVIVSALVMAGASDLAQKWGRVEALRSATSADLVALRAAEAELDARDLTGNGIADVAQFLDQAGSAFSGLLAARELRSETSKVTRLALGPDGIRLSLAAPNVLAAVREMGEGAWEASVDGPIVADAASGGETATILLRGPS